MNKTRAWIHIIAGIAYIVIAALVIAYQSFGTIALGSGLSYALGALLAFYGGFRIWRGIRDLQILRSAK